MYIHKGLPDRLLSGTLEQRLKTDNVQTGFFEGRFFRTFRELSVPTGQVAVIRATVPIGVILWGLRLSLHSAAVRFQTVLNGTAGGTWTAMPVLRKNALPSCPAYIPQVTFDVGGTVAGGTVIDSNRLYAQAQPNRLITVGAVPLDERGAMPGVYFFRIENIDGAAALCDFSAIWEEKPCS